MGFTPGQGDCMKKLIVILVVLCVLAYVSRSADIDLIELIHNLPQEINILIKNLRNPEKREILKKELSRRVRHIESTITDIKFGMDEDAQAPALEQFVSIELTNGLRAEGQLLRRTNQGDFVLQVPGSQVTIAKEEVKAVHYIEGEAARILKEVIAQDQAFNANEKAPENQAMEAALGLTHRWESNIPKALEIAMRQNKLVMIDFSTTWCGWCTKLDKDTFKNNRVQTVLNKYFVSVRLDGDENPQVVRQYNVRGYPNIVFLDKKGNVVMQKAGYLPPEHFIELLYLVVEQSGAKKT
jgi:thiol-disulfide isomerase/thioredoxin